MIPFLLATVLPWHQTVESLGLFKIACRVSTTGHVFLLRSKCQTVVNA